MLTDIYLHSHSFQTKCCQHTADIQLAQTDIIFMGGTFKAVLNLFYQPYMIYVEYQDHFIALVHVLLSGFIFK